jgi:oligopeptide/dipeptide ABC transporter ATP-binding protein
LIASNPEADPEYERKHAHVPIKGEIPSPINVPPGCRFSGRCPDVMEHCHRVTPEVIKKSDSQGVACLLYA